MCGTVSIYVSLSGRKSRTVMKEKGSSTRSGVDAVGMAYTTVDDLGVISIVHVLVQK